jgi:hypothetical protein
MLRHDLFRAVPRWELTRCLAVFLVVLAVTPFTAPFSAFDPAESAEKSVQTGKSCAKGLHDGAVLACVVTVSRATAGYDAVSPVAARLAHDRAHAQRTILRI